MSGFYYCMLHQLSSQLHSEHKLHLQRLHQAFYMHCQMGQDPLQRHRPSRLPRHPPSLFTLLCPYWPLLPRPALLPFSSRVQIPSGSRPGETCHCAGRAIPAAAAFGHSRVSALFRMAGARQSVGEETGRTGRGRREREERGSTKMMKPVFGMGCLWRQAGPRGCSVWPWHRLSFWSSCVR